jgi:hypothetical protein
VIPVLISILVLAAAAGVLSIGLCRAAAAEVVEVPEAPTEPMLTLEGPDGQTVTYTLTEAHEAMAQFRARRNQLVERLEERDPGRLTPAEEERWALNYQEAVALTAAINSLARALP